MSNVQRTFGKTVTSNAGAPGNLILGLEYIELCVGNAQQAAHYLHSKFGFTPLQRSGLDTGALDETAFLLNARDVNLIVRSALQKGPVAEHVFRHGDSIRDIALAVDDVDAAFEQAVRNGAKPLMEPQPIGTAEHSMIKATVGTPGDVVHSLFQKGTAGAAYLPGGKLLEHASGKQQPSFKSIDHVALAVEQGQLEAWVDYYRSAFGFEITHEETTATALTGMRSKVVENKSRTVKFPIVEPRDGKKRSQVEEFLKYHNGPGVQHIALLCDDIASTVGLLRQCGVEFLDIPDDYYNMLPSRLGELGQQLQVLQTMRLLIDRDEWGELIQTFSRPITSRPTLFLELVQRNGARSFGAGNIRALFEAIEREQAARAGW
jgi:4-hydroxyphenylpyruvate dioxygenase